MSQNLMPQDLDLSFLYDIADGSTEFIVESIDMFLQHTPELLGTITTGIAADDWGVVAAAAHKLKPNLGFFGMNLSHALIIEIESACKAGGQNPAEIKAKFNQLTGIIDDAFVRLNEIKAEKEANL